MSIGNNHSLETRAWVGHGSILLSAIDATDRPTGGWSNVGTCKAASLALATESLEIKETQSGTNSITHKITTAQTGTITINTISFKPDTLAKVLYGDLFTDAEAAAQVHTDEAYLGKIVLVPGIMKTLTSVTNVGATITYVEGVNFISSDSGIEIMADQTGADDPIVDAQDIVITYVKAAASRIEGFKQSSVEVAIAFTGLNVADMSKASKVIYHKVSLSPAAQRALISAEAEGEMEIVGTLLAAAYITDSTKSKLFAEEHAA